MAGVVSFVIRFIGLDNSLVACDELLPSRYGAINKPLKERIEDNAWDGEWYRRAYFDDGTPLGSKENEECKIDSIAQAGRYFRVGDKTRAHRVCVRQKNDWYEARQDHSAV